MSLRTHLTSSSQGARGYLLCDGCGAVLAVEPAQLDEVPPLTHFPIAGQCADCAARTSDPT